MKLWASTLNFHLHGFRPSRGAESSRTCPLLIVVLLLCTLATIMIGGCGTEVADFKVGIQNDSSSRRAAEIALAVSSSQKSSYRLETCVETVVTSINPHHAIDSAYQFMAEPNLLAVVGYSSSGATLATARLFNHERIPQIVPGATSPLLSETGPWTFRLCPDDIHQAQFLAEKARNRFRAERCGILYQNNDYGRELCRLFEEEFQKRDGAVIFKAPGGSGGSFEAELGIYAAEILEANPDLLLFLCQPGSAGNVRAALDRLDLSIPILASDALCNSNIFRYETDLYTGIHVAVFYHHSLPTTGNHRFVQAFKEKASFYPDQYAALVYDAVRLIRQACDTGVRTREELRSYLQRLGADLPAFEGITGPISFNADRICQRPMYLARIDPDGICLLETLDEEPRK